MGTIQIDGSTPKLTIGNATAEDATILFDGNAQDFYIALDDSADDLLIGLGSTVGSTPIISMDENKKVSLAADLDVTTVATAATFEPDGDTAAGDNAAIGYTASEGLILTGQGSTDDVTIKNDADATVLQVATGTTNVEITAGNLIIGTSGKGIDFSATADSGGTMTSELFDDYEEGTWTPTMGTDGSNFTESSQLGFYTKIGRQVFVNGEVTTSSINGQSGNLQIMGWPFTVSSTAGNYSGGPVIYASGLAITSGTALSWRVDTDGTGYIHNFDEADGGSAMSAAEWSDNGTMRFSGTFWV
jgi:hypothetical protein